MAKKKQKKTKQQSQPVTPEKFLLEGKARNLPIDKCYKMTATESIVDKTAIVMVTRKHTTGKVTFALIHVDPLCRGVIHCLYEVAVDSSLVDQIMDSERNNVEEITYEEAHNYIYGAVAFAEEAGITPPKEFRYAEMVLEEDTEDIPLIEYEYGDENGRYMLIVENKQELNRYIHTLRKNLPEDKWGYLDIDDVMKRLEIREKELKNELLYGGDYDEDDDEDDSVGDEDICGWRVVDEVDYSYEHPEYPKELVMENEKLRYYLYDELWDDDFEHIFGTKYPEHGNFFQFQPSHLKHLLEGDRESVKRDLENVVLYEIGKVADYDSVEEMDKAFESFQGIQAMLMSLVLLAEVGDEKSLDTVFELMRQKRCVMEYFFGFATEIDMEVLIPTICLLGRKHLDMLKEFELEEGIPSRNKMFVSAAITVMLDKGFISREDCVAWYHEVLSLCLEHIEECKRCDGDLIGDMTCDILDYKLKELLPDLESLYATGLVNERVCGDISEVRGEFNRTSISNTSNWQQYLREITERLVHLCESYNSHDYKLLE